MRVAANEIFSILEQIGGILKSDFRLSDLLTEKHGMWSSQHPCYTCRPPVN